MINLRVTIILFATGLCANGAMAQQDNDSSSQETSAETPYEVVITGRLTKSRLRNMIEQVEEDYFKKFNELNVDDMYDMYCYEYTPTMSHIKKRTCEPLFMIRQRAADGADIAFAFGTSGISAGANGAIGGLNNNFEVSRRSNRKRDYEVLVEKLEEHTATNKELGEIASVMQSLKLQLENFDDQ